ncbi:hypothetical protein GGF32_007689 [Allomyces javanicus]|nr:hypothetical protein GGF32_007689 [Allomyces javanicus]
MWNEADAPALALLDYYHLRTTLGPEGLLFLHADGRLPTAEWVKKLLREHTGRPLTGHSLRASAATYLSSYRVLTDQLQRLGRWRSDAYKRYLRDDPSPA